MSDSRAGWAQIRGELAVQATGMPAGLALFAGAGEEGQRSALLCLVHPTPIPHRLTLTPAPSLTHAQTPRTQNPITGILQRMSREMNELSPGTVDLLRAFLASPRGAACVAADADLDAGAAVTFSRAAQWRLETLRVNQGWIVKGGAEAGQGRAWLAQW